MKFLKRLRNLAITVMLILVFPNAAAAELTCNSEQKSIQFRAKFDNEIPSALQLEDADRQKRDALLMEVEAWLGLQFKDCGRTAPSYRHGLETYTHILSSTFKTSRSRFFQAYISRLNDGKTVWLDDDSISELERKIQLLETAGYQRLASRLREISSYRLSVEKPADYSSLADLALKNAAGNLFEGDNYGAHEWSDHAIAYLRLGKLSKQALVRARMINGDILARRFRYKMAVDEYLSAVSQYTNNFAELSTVDPSVLDHLAKSAINNPEFEARTGLGIAHALMSRMPRTLSVSKQNRRFVHTASYLHLVTGRLTGHAWPTFNMLWEGTDLAPFLSAIPEGKFGARSVNIHEMYANYLEFAWAYVHPNEQTTGTSKVLPPVELSKLTDPQLRARIFTSLINLGDAKFSKVEAAYLNAEAVPPGLLSARKDHPKLLQLLTNRARIEHFYEELVDDNEISDIESSSRLFELAFQNETEIKELAGEVIMDGFVPALDLSRTIAPSDLKRNLKEDEAALLIFDGNIGVHFALITKHEIVWQMSPILESKLDGLVDSVRYSLDQIPKPEGYYEREFDYEASHMIYDTVIRPFERYLTNKTRLLVYSTSVFSTIPPGLIGYSPSGRPDSEQSVPSDFVFLMDRFETLQFTDLEDLVFRQSDNSQRDKSRRSKFLAFGNPSLDGKSYTRGMERIRSLDDGVETPIHNFASRLGVADGNALRSLHAIPGTARELNLIGDLFGDESSSIFTGDLATEQRVKQTDYSTARIVSFATHGLPESSSVLEAGLVLTPPARPSEADDGFLVASEIRSLVIPVDLVILSACDTASGRMSGGPFTSPEGPAFEGLVTAFQAAGARQILATHWPLRDDVAPDIMQRIIEIEQENETSTFSSALRQAVLEFRIENASDLEYSHPAVWGPFTIVGL